MIPFAQTFVLASPSPRKYYVLNDIFRYVGREDSKVFNKNVKPQGKNGLLFEWYLVFSILKGRKLN